MGIFDFGNIKNNERTIRKTWDEFRDALAMEKFSYNDIEKAKKCTFLKVYNDLFYDNFGIKHSTLKLNPVHRTDRMAARCRRHCCPSACEAVPMSCHS